MCFGVCVRSDLCACRFSAITIPLGNEPTSSTTCPFGMVDSTLYKAINGQMTQLLPIHEIVAVPVISLIRVDLLLETILRLLTIGLHPHE